MLIEGNDKLFVPIFEDMGPAPIEAVNGFALVGDHHIHQHQIGSGVQNGISRSWLCGRFLLRTAERNSSAYKSKKES
jgi:hypothetical protein